MRTHTKVNKIGFSKINRMNILLPQYNYISQLKVLETTLK
jgi:hypothetical protein